MDSVYSLKEVIKRKYSSKKYHNKKLESFLFSKGVKRNKFFTDDSYLYFKCNDKNSSEVIKFRSKNKLFDSLNHLALKDYSKFKGGKSDFLFIQYKKFANKVQHYQENFVDKGDALISNYSILKLWNVSILAAIIIGMISMSFIYRYLGQGVAAGDVAINKEVAGASTVVSKEDAWTKEKEDKYTAELEKYLKIEADKEFNIKVRELVKGYPIEDFLPYLLNEDHEVVAFYIAIAKKESNWGKRVPVLNGKDCYNYVGYRGGGDRLGSGGHSCFVDRQEAVKVVSKRLKILIEEYNRDTAKEMVVWKCGSDCGVTGGQAAANKWISDVDRILKALKEE